MLLVLPASERPWAVSMAPSLQLPASSAGSNQIALHDHSATTFRLITTIADFTQKLSEIHEQHSEELQLLVEDFRKQNAELRREKPNYQNSLFHTWEILLQEVEFDSQAHSDMARSLSRHVGVSLLEKTFHRKIQSRKVFLHRESLETILGKAEDMLQKCYQDYVEGYRRLTAQPSPQHLADYYDLHNAYVQQLHATNGMLEEYHSRTLPAILQELEEIYCSLSDTTATSIAASMKHLTEKAREQAAHYDNVVSASKAVNTRADLQNFIRTLSRSSQPQQVQPADQGSFVHPFVASHAENNEYLNPELALRDELVLDRLPEMTTNPGDLEKELGSLDSQIRHIQDNLDSMLRLQQRSLENNLFNKTNELQEDISMKKFDLQVACIHHAAVGAQLELFKGRSDMMDLSPESEAVSRERKSSTSSIKNRWLRALRSLKTSPEKTEAKNEERKRSTDGGTLGSHLFQEHSFKKLTACEVCQEILKGHSRQGLRCKMCKMNVHSQCQGKVASKCLAKSKMLRRQRSAEVEPKAPTNNGQPAAAPMPAMQENGTNSKSVDPVYQLLKQAGDLGRPDTQSGSRPYSTASSSSSSSQLLSVAAPPHMSCSAPHSPQRRKLSLRMKSFSLDSPESSERVHRTLHAPSHHNHSPQSPGRRRQLLAASKTIKTGSVDLPDVGGGESSASTSPCPSPRQTHRLLPTNLYVALYSFRSRHQDELSLKAGCTVTVTDTSDPDWWQGKCVGRAGYFPAKYVARLLPGERALQVVHNVQVPNGQEMVKLARDQIVIQIGDPTEDGVPIRTPDKKTFCPLKYIQEI